MNEYDDALIYYNKTLTLSRKNNDRANEASALNNIGNVYLNVGKYDSALNRFQLSLEIKRTLPNKRSMAITLNNLGEVLMKSKRFAESERYYQESLAIKRESNDRLGQVKTLNNLAHCKIQTKEYNAAKLYLDEAENLERTIGGALNERKNNLQFRITLNRAIKNYAKASDYAEQLLLVKDSLLSIEKAQAMADIQIKYETEKKEQQLEILNAEQALNQTTIKSKNLWIITLIIAITLVLIIAILVYNSFRLAKKARLRGETLMKELHHRVKNNLQVLSSVLSLQSQHMTDENALLSVKSTEGRINAMALIHRKLYSDETNTIVSTRGYFRELIEYLTSSYGFGENRLKLIVEIDEVELDVDKAIPLGLIANELISNVFKHAYVNQEKSELTIILKQRDQQLDVIVKDNGKGFKPGPNSDEEKFGSRMVAILVKDIRGIHTIDSSNGTTHTLTIPLA
jgi:two-component sensor histidine kinase